MFRFANGEYLYLLALIPLLMVLLALVSHRRKRLLARFGNTEIIKELIPDFSAARIRLKALLYLTALTLLIFAAARPQLGSKLREEKAEGVEMMLVVDVSNSMLAEDFEPNRLERTKYAINKLFEGLQQERVGLVAFAGEPKVQLPITSDYRMAQAFAKRLSPTLVGEQGTDVGKALELAMLSFSSQSERSRVIVLITDGENHEDDAIAVAQKVAEMALESIPSVSVRPRVPPSRLMASLSRTRMARWSYRSWVRLCSKRLPPPPRRPTCVPPSSLSALRRLSRA